MKYGIQDGDSNDLYMIRNTVYQLVLSVILEYKTMQAKVAAAFFDIAFDMSEKR